MLLNRKGIFISVIVLGCTIAGCSGNNEQDKKNINGDQPKGDYNIRFDTILRKFEYDWYRAYDNDIDRFLVEDQFSKVIKSDLRYIIWRPGKMLINSYDTMRKRREMMFMDDNANFFYMAAKNNDYTNDIKAGDSVKIRGELLGFRIDKDKVSPELSTPSFIVAIDSIKIIKRRDRN